MKVRLGLIGVALLVLASVLAGCGVKGEPSRPPAITDT